MPPGCGSHAKRRLVPERSRGCGEAIGRTLAADDLAGIFVLSDGLNVNGSELVAGITERRSARQCRSLADSRVMARVSRRRWSAPTARRAHHAVGAVGFYGTAIRIGHGSAGGWDEFGPRRRITRSRGNVLFELDGEPALDLYERYLGEDEARACRAPRSCFRCASAIRSARTTTSSARSWPSTARRAR